MQVFRAALWQQDNWFIAHCKELDIATQGGSAGEAALNIQEALALFLELSESEIQTALDPTSAPMPADCDRGKRAWRSFREVRFRLEDCGFLEIDQRPNHARFSKKQPKRSVIMPHYSELADAVVASILRQAQLPEDDLDRGNIAARKTGI